MSATDPAAQITWQLVDIINIEPVTGKVMCRTTYAEEFQIDGTLRMKGTGWPKPGERWGLQKFGSSWVLSVCLGTVVQPEITGTQQGLPDAFLQVLRALDSAGIVKDSTVPVPESVVVDDPVPDYPDEEEDDSGDGITDDDGGEDDYEDAPDDYSGPEGEDDGSGSGGTQSDDAPTPATSKPTPKPSPPKKTPAATKIWYPLYVTTYNTLKDVGPAGAHADLVKLTKTRADIICTQEAHSNARDAGFASLASRGWDRYRPKEGAFSDENTILWKTSRFTRLDSGSIYLGQHTTSSSHMPPRYLNWVKLHDKTSNRPIFIMDTHLDPHLEYAGAPRREASVAVRIQVNEAMIRTIAAKMAQFGKIAPVFTAGDWNIDFFADRRKRTKNFPVSKFATVDTISNWAIESKKHKPGTSGSRCIDQIYGTRLPSWHVKVIQNFVLTGYKSDHRPAMVKYMIRTK